MENKLNVGLVGVGHLGRIHLAKLLNIEFCNFVGFYDIDREKSDRIAGEIGTNPAESLEDLIDEVDIVSIVVPTKSHYEVGQMAIEAGKHIFMEKPFTETVEQGRELLNMAQSKNLKFGVGHI
jgi:predicted dehydrogenase